MIGARLACLVATACLACGARTPLADEAPDAGLVSDAPSTGVTLSIPLGRYEGCTSSTVTTRPRFVGATGRGGSITLRQQGDGVVATLDLPTYASGAVAFVPTSAGSAALRAAQTFDVQIADADFGVVPVTATAGALSLVGPTLFLSTHGTNGPDDVSTFFRCPVPAGVAPTAVTTSAPPPAALHAGVYQSCTATSGTEGPLESSLSGGSGPLTVTLDGATLRLSWPDSLLPELSCRGLDFGAAPVRAALADGQRCELSRPCGPPPTLGMSTAPATATLTGMRGSMTVNGTALFVDLLGDAGATACGVHDLSITCANP